MRGADHPGHGAGFHHGDRLPPCLGDRHGAAVGAHDGDLAAEIFAAGEGFDASQIIAHARPHIGVQRRRRGALIFAKFAQNFVARGDEGVWAEPPQRLAGHDLMRRVGVGMQEADGDGLDAEAVEMMRQPFERRHVEGDEHLARGVHPLVRLEGEVARHQRARAMEIEVEGVRPVAAAERVDVAKALRGDERGGGPAAFQHGVDRNGRAVQQFVHRRHIAAGEAQRGGGPDGRIGRDGQRLGGDDGAVLEADEVREGAADIDADDVHGVPTDAVRNAP